MSPQPGPCGHAPHDVTFGPFRVRYASGCEPRVEEYRLRYETFVQEHGWESADSCPDGLERDAFDRFSCSSLVIDSATGALAGCQRLILPELLPCDWLTNAEREYRPLPSVAGIDFTSLPRRAWAEASRLAIARPYRWGATTTMPAIVAISYATLALGLATGRSLLFNLSDPRTLLLTRRLGIAMQQVGEVVEFHGRRALFRITLADVLAGVPAAWQAPVEQLIDSARQATAGAIDRPFRRTA